MTVSAQLHDEINLLLPWYVNESLGPIEHDRVTKHMAGCTACQENAALLVAVQAAVVRNKATPIVPQPPVNQLLDMISAKSPIANTGWQQSKTAFTAAVVTLVLIATLILTNQDDRTEVPQLFETATSDLDGASMDYVLRLQFESGTSAADRDRVLQDIEARDVSGGAAEGSYRVIVRLSAASLEELGRYTDGLESLTEVRSVSVVALQLPVQSGQ